MALIKNSRKDITWQRLPAWNHDHKKIENEIPKKERKGWQNVSIASRSIFMPIIEEE